MTTKFKVGDVVRLTDVDSLHLGSLYSNGEVGVVHENTKFVTAGAGFTAAAMMFRTQTLVLISDDGAEVCDGA